jgi:hypothetical protein
MSLLLAVVCCSTAVVAAQSAAPPGASVREFLGTWAMAMTNPAGAQETVRVWEESGLARASVQSGRFPPIPVTAMLRDGDVLILSLTRFENGKPDRAIVSLTLDGDTMQMAQMLEFSQTIKRGSGKKVNSPAAP